MGNDGDEDMRIGRARNRRWRGGGGGGRGERYLGWIGDCRDFDSLGLV